MTTAAALWSRLVAAGVAVGERPPAQDDLVPWYVRLMLGIAGVIAAAFLIGFVALGLRFIMESTGGSIAAGLAMIASAYALFRVSRSDFSSMFGFAVSVAGQVLLAEGVFRIFDSHRSALPWSVMGAIQVVLALAMPNYIHRVTSAFAAPVCLAMALSVHGAPGLAAGLAAAAVAALWLNELRVPKYHAVLAPIGYGLTAALIYIQAEREAKPWVGNALVLVALLAAVFSMARRAGWPPRSPRMLATIAAAAAVGAASFKAPGVAAGLMIVLLGFANGNRVLTGGGIAALLFYVSKYYYLLDVTLLAKSGVLAATGAALLAVRWLMLKLVLKGGDGA